MSAVGLPCDGDGICMACKKKSPEEEAVVCHTCRTPWHVPCLSKPPESMASVASWVCPDCALPASDFPVTIADEAQTEQEKRRKRQELWGGGAPVLDGEEGAKRKKQRGSDVSDLIDEDLICAICMQLLERPVTTTCGHNFCLKCFQKWVGQSKYTCAKCRAQIPRSMASLPRINLVLVLGIREAKAKKTCSDGPAHVVHYIRNEDRPVEAFRTERAKKAGKANACSGQILVTIPPDHFGPITKEYTKSGEGVCVGSTWVDRMQCRQWGIHFPHVAGIAGQCDYGAQSVALSGGYEDDEDHGEWFLYTGSGGRDLSGNKRTSKEQSFDQKFEKLNQALRVSCQKGYPVRVVRSHKEKRSFYAPENGYRYDGIYRIEMCWRKVGIQGFKVCRYLFVRCDNDPAPWTSDTLGDRPRPLPNVAELKKATDITTRKGTPAWDYDECDGWKWVKPPPASRKLSDIQDPDGRKRGRRTVRHGHSSVQDRLFKEFSCSLCKDILKLPLTTPCAHNFCKTCLLGAFDGIAAVRERTGGGRTLRMQKVIRKCPSCSNDISDFLQNPQVNRQMSDLIELLQHKAKEENDNGTTVDVEAADGDSEINAVNSEEGTDVESLHKGLSVSND